MHLLNLKNVKSVMETCKMVHRYESVTVGRE